MRSPHAGDMQVLSHSKGIVSSLPQRSKVAIIGSGASCVKAPFDDPSFEIWGCNSLWPHCKDSQGLFRADRWFEMHPMSVQTPAEMDAIRQCPIPIYTLTDESDWCVNSAQYPLEAVFKAFPYHFFTCTFAYQIALALHEGFTSIHLYGVDFSNGSAREQLVEQACVSFWIGIAIGRGVDVHVEDEGQIVDQTHLYGYEYKEEIDSVDKQVDYLFWTRFHELQRKGQITAIQPTMQMMQEGHA